jgi:hypothetical protein
METSSTQESKDQEPLVNNPQPSAAPGLSPEPSAEKAQIKQLLGEARGTRDVLVGFRAAVESGTFNGHKMMELAKGLAFLEAILNQNQAHVKNLQARLDA